MLDLLKKYRTPLLTGCLVLAALLVYSANLRHQDRTTFFERLVLQVTAPLQKGIDVGWKTASGWWQHYLWLIDTQQDNERLTLENRRLRAELVGMQEIRLANERLHRLLEFRETTHLPALAAQVIAEDASSWFRTVVIDRGSADGLRQGLPVVVAEGVVGRIIVIAPHQSRVLLITDASSAVASLVQGNRTRGISRGKGNLLTFDYAVRQAQIEVGDPIITSGTGGIFPKGLPIGQVTRVTREAFGLFQAVEVAPVVDFARLEEVLVLITDQP
ncbi:MAG: rod shape-determining protein MreC [Desulfuromonadales bacterium]|nr:rod shape-determining protein MreC [Desulfuromonadales bacterium]